MSVANFPDQSIKFINHYDHNSMNQLNIIMCDRFERRLSNYIYMTIRGVKIKELRLVTLISSRGGVLASVAVKYGRTTIAIDVHASFDVDEYDQQIFRFTTQWVYLGK